MKMLITAATAAEIHLLNKHFDLQDKDFTETEQFDVLVTGVGMTATAFALGQHLSSKYKLILNLGIAGCFDTSVPLGTVFNIVTDVFAELGAEDHNQFLGIETLGFGKSTYHVSESGDYPPADQLPKAKGITVNTVHGNAESIQQAIQRFQPLTESMEGAAVLYAAEKMQIPCLQIRSISNYVEPRDRSKWQIGKAVSSLNEWAIGFLTNQ